MYQSLIIAVTFILACIFIYYTYHIYLVTQRLNANKQFVVVVGGIINFAFLLRCVFFLIVLSVDFVSDIYMFIVLLITEVIMMFVIQLQFNSNIFQRLTTYVQGSIRPEQERERSSSTTGSGSKEISS